MAENTCKVINYPVLSLFIEADADIFPSSVTVLFPSYTSVKYMTKYYNRSSDKTPVNSKSVWPVMWLAARPGRITLGNNILFSMHRMDRKWVDTGHVWKLWRRENLLHLRTNGRM